MPNTTIIFIFISIKLKQQQRKYVGTLIKKKYGSGIKAVDQNGPKAKLVYACIFSINIKKGKCRHTHTHAHTCKISLLK